MVECEGIEFNRIHIGNTKRDEREGKGSEVEEIEHSGRRRDLEYRFGAGV